MGDRSLTRRIAVVACAGVGLVACTSGCTSANKFADSISHTVQSAARPEPASQLYCFWHRSLTPLKDPTRDGQKVLGLPGQMFLITPSGASAVADGELTVMVYDETPRPPGVPARTPEMWHHTKETLRQLATNDERFGGSHALFLPWPPEWQDVTVVRVAAMYRSPGNPDLETGEQRISIDFSTPGAANAPRIVNDRAIAGMTYNGGIGFDTRGVPDPQKYLQQMRAAAATSNPASGALSTSVPVNSPPVQSPPVVPPGPSNPVVPAGAWSFPAGRLQPQAAPPTVPVPPGGAQPIIIPSRPGI